MLMHRSGECVYGAIAFAPAVALPAEAHGTGGPASAICDFEIRWITRCVILRAPRVASANIKPGVHLNVLCRSLVPRTAPLFIDIGLSKRPGKHENECGGESYKRCEHRVASGATAISPISISEALIQRKDLPSETLYP